MTSVKKPGTKCGVEPAIDLALPAWPPLAGQEPKAVFPSAPCFPPTHFQLNSQVPKLASEPKWFPGKLVKKNPSFKTFSLQPREQSHAFHKGESPEPKNSISCQNVSLTKDSGRDEKCYLRLSEHALCVFLYLTPI